MSESRIIASFSCGAASAVATKLALEDFGTERVTIINIEIKEEHPDNRRFLADCEQWFDAPIEVLRDTKYNASIIELFLKRRFITGPGRTPCSAALKRDVAARYYRPDDEVVLGYTYEEQRRADRFIDANNERRSHFPLIHHKLTHADCLALIQRQGIELPAMYRLGFHNANCVGCVRGGQAYWNKIKEVFPEQFERMAAVEQQIGAGVLRYRSGPKKGEKMPLRELQPTKRPLSQEPDISCSIHCELADEINLPRRTNKR